MSSIRQRRSRGCAALDSDPSTEHKQCKRASNWISLKRRFEKENAVTESWELPEFWEFNEGTYRIACLFILSCLIFKSRVDRGIPSLAALLGCSRGANTRQAGRTSPLPVAY